MITKNPEDVISNLNNMNETDEIWNNKIPKKGDHIRVDRGLYNHHGIYISDSEVIHFTGRDADNILDWSNNEVINTNLEEFKRGDILEVKSYTDEEIYDLYPISHIVNYSRACLGDKGYNLIFNNCEHFANVCTLGRFRSTQVQEFFKLLDLTGKDKWPNQQNKGGYNMGLLDKVGKFFSGIFGKSKSRGSRSTSNYNYEPDKVKVAEIEANTQLKLAGKEQERIELMKEAELELLQFNLDSKLAIEEAKARGFNAMAQSIVLMQEKLNDISKKRMEIIQKGSLSVIKEIESYYKELGDKIEADNNNYSKNKLPELLEVLANYEEGTPSHDLYKKRVEQDMDLQFKHHQVQINSLADRQNRIINNFLSNKDKITEQTSQITKDIMKQITSNFDESVNEKELELLDKNKTKMIE